VAAVAAPVVEPADTAELGKSSPAPWQKMTAAMGTGLTLALGSPASANPVVANSVITNPVLASDSPDPGVIRVDNTWHMVTTGDDQAGAFPMYASPDLVNWKREGEIFPAGQGPSWSDNSFWAPEVHAVDGKYVAYFTARDHDGVLRIGAATSDTVTGPFKDLGHPLVSEGKLGVIDPTFFKDDDGKQYVYWKEDGNGAQPQQPSRILASEVSADGTQLVGEPKVVLQNDPKSWEDTVVEAPEMVKHGKEYYLFYSGNCYANANYAEGVARSDSPEGPFVKEPAPFLHTSDEWKGPGHAAFTTDSNGKDWVVYHAWEKGHEGGAPGREVLIDPMTWGSDNWPHVLNDQPSNTVPNPPAQ
jgi:arabinan endo-1,5-alpha-L-arabinosidase